MKNWTQKERQALIGRGKVVINKVAEEYNRRMFPTINQVVRNENGSIPQFYAANYALRLKKSDRSLAETLWVNHVYMTADPKRKGTNLLRSKARTSRYAIKEAGGERNRHLAKKMGKLVAAGVLLGFKIETGDESEKEYGNQYLSDKATGYGFKPLVASFGKGFYYYFSPLFIEAMAPYVPHDVKVEIYTADILHAGQAQPLFFQTPSENRPCSPPVTKCATYVKSSRIARNEVMSQKASSVEERGQEDKEQEGLNRRPNAGRKVPEEKKGNSAAPSIYFSAEEIQEDIKTGSIARKMATEGKMIVASAVLLVQMYLRKIAPNTGRAYHPKCIETALNEAINLMSQYSEKDQDQAFRAYSSTIDRVAERYKRQDGFFVVTPDKWLSPQYNANIDMHHKHYLVPWHNRRSEFDEWQYMTDAKKAQEEGNGDDWARDSSIFSGLAYSLKDHLKRHHKNDYRLEKADLHRWTVQIRAMVRKDGIPYERAVSVAKWLLTSDANAAKWWISEACYGMGIRSASSFRKHFPKIESAYIQASNTDRQFTA